MYMSIISLTFNHFFTKDFFHHNYIIDNVSKLLYVQLKYSHVCVSVGRLLLYVFQSCIKSSKLVFSQRNELLLI